MHLQAFSSATPAQTKKYGTKATGLQFHFRESSFEFDFETTFWLWKPNFDTVDLYFGETIKLLKIEKGY